ncbi:MAG: hypothetical protein B0D92_04990 [Spirochaeta sp. LUC14_002_19_P3]|nr:MAG: hypothetical protein B0D92_04990 [Spirochaeta sp. LUC14_002_19_P3]
MGCFIRIALFIFVSAHIFASDILIQSGISELGSGRAQRASSIFQKVLNDRTQESLANDALYWLVKTEIHLKNYETAANYADQFITKYSSDRRMIEIQYHQARLLYLRGYPEKAIIALGNYSVTYPKSPLAASARYWIAESLISLGQLEEAKQVLQDLLKSYPASIKNEAAQHRLSEIEFLYREQSLLDLLRWSHENYLGNAEDMQRQRMEYYDALKGLSDTESQSAAKADIDFLERLSRAKSTLLNLYEFYTNELIEAQQ